MATERHRGAILAVRISFGVFAGLLCLGQISFVAVSLLIFAQATAPPPIPQPHMIPVFLAVTLLWLLAVMPFFFWLQWFLPRRFQRRGASYGKVTTVYVIAKLLAIGAAEGAGLFWAGYVPDPAEALAVYDFFDPEHRIDRRKYSAGTGAAGDGCRFFLNGRLR
jgi:hypothetical protein